MDGKGHDLGCELYQPPPDKYRTKAHQLIEHWLDTPITPDGSEKVTFAATHLEKSLAAALAEAAREAMERVVQIINEVKNGSFTPSRVPGVASTRRQMADRIAEAIRKETP